MSVGIGCPACTQRVEIDLGDGDARRLDPERLRPVGPQLAEDADLVSVDEQPRRPAGMECGGLDAAELAIVDAESRDQRLERPLEIEEVELALSAALNGPVAPAGRQTRSPKTFASRGSSPPEGR